MDSTSGQCNTTNSGNIGGVAFVCCATFPGRRPPIYLYFFEFRKVRFLYSMY